MLHLLFNVEDTERPSLRRLEMTFQIFQAFLKGCASRAASDQVHLVCIRSAEGHASPF